MPSNSERLAAISNPTPDRAAEDRFEETRAHYIAKNVRAEFEKLRREGYEPETAQLMAENRVAARLPGNLEDNLRRIEALMVGLDSEEAMKHKKVAEQKKQIEQRKLEKARQGYHNPPKFDPEQAARDKALRDKGEAYRDNRSYPQLYPEPSSPQPYAPPSGVANTTAPLKPPATISAPTVGVPDFSTILQNFQSFLQKSQAPDGVKIRPVVGKMNDGEETKDRNQER